MISFKFHSSEEIAVELGARLRSRRLAQNLTQEGLARRSGVPLGTLKKFERSGQIALLSFIRLVVAMKDETALEALLQGREYQTIDQVLVQPKTPKRGRIK